MACRFVSYLRVSTQRQGRSGLGLEAQRAAVQFHAQQQGCRITAEFVEVESGRKSERLELAKAIKMARKTKATLLISKLDRLSRDVRFLYQLRDEGVEFVACDMPSANKFMLNLMINFAEHEAEAISKRTKEALAAAKARGVRLGGPLGAKAFGRSYRIGSANGVKRVKALANDYAADLAEDVEALKAEGFETLQAIADELNERGIVTRRGGQWHPTSVQRLLERLPA